MAEVPQRRHYPEPRQGQQTNMAPALICPSCDRKRSYLYDCVLCGATHCSACGTGTSCVECDG